MKLIVIGPRPSAHEAAEFGPGWIDPYQPRLRPRRRCRHRRHRGCCCREIEVEKGDPIEFTAEHRSLQQRSLIDLQLATPPLLTMYLRCCCRHRHRWLLVIQLPVLPPDPHNTSVVSSQSCFLDTGTDLVDHNHTGRTDEGS